MTRVILPAKQLQSSRRVNPSETVSDCQPVISSKKVCVFMIRIKSVCQASLLFLPLSLIAGSLAAEQSGPAADTPFEQEYQLTEVRSSKAPQNDIRAVAVSKQGKVWVASGAGVYSIEGESSSPRTAEGIEGPSYDVLIDRKQIPWVAAWDGVYRQNDGRFQRIGELPGPITVLEESPTGIIAAGPDGIFYLEDDHWKQHPALVATSIRDLLYLGEAGGKSAEESSLAVATGIGLYLVDGDKVRRIAGADEILSSDVRSVALNADGELWIGTAAGIDVYKQGQRVRSITGAEGLPCADVKCIAFDDSGNAWVGTSLGVARGSQGKWTLRHSRRWVPSDEVRDVAFSPKGAAWIATSGGLSALAYKPMTLQDKAAHYQRLVRARHVRPPGLVEKCRLATPGDLSSFEDMDTDNDGSYTGMYVAAEAYRYAVTGAEDARNNATESFNALEFLHNVTESDGFFARTVVPSTWEHVADMNRTYTPVEIAEARVDEPRFKRVEVRWRPSSDGKWLWKGDTSSDEVTGHYYAFAIYHELVADENEKKRAAELVRRLTDYIISGGFVLRDQDGAATRWGVWSPEKLNQDPNWRLDRGINSVEILSFLLTAHHMTGDKKYLDELERLYDDHGYRENILEPQQLDPGSFTHIDFELLAMAYHGLLKYAVDPERKKVYQQSFETWFSPVRNEASPFYAYTYKALGGQGDFRPQACVAFLRELPLDMIEWTIDNRQREDLRLVRLPSSELWQTDRLLPASERAVSRWDRNPFAALRGAGAAVESSSVYWLLPYWMGRYYDLIAGP